MTPTPRERAYEAAIARTRETGQPAYAGFRDADGSFWRVYFCRHDGHQHHQPCPDLPTERVTPPPSEAFDIGRANFGELSAPDAYALASKYGMRPHELDAWLAVEARQASKLDSFEIIPQETR